MAGNNPQITATISAQDHASAVLKAVAQLANNVAKEIEKTGQTAAFNTLPKHIDAATLAADRHVAALARIKDAFSGIATAAAAYAAIKLPQGAHSAFATGQHIQHEERQLFNAGIPAEELDAAKKQILEIQKDLPQIELAGGLERYKELRSVIKDLHEVPGLLPATLQAEAQMKASGQNTEGLVYAIKAAEILGRANDPAEYTKTLESIVKAQQVMGKTVSPEQMYEVAKMSKASGSQLSDRFLFNTGFSLAQEMGGGSAGNSINQFAKQVTGGFQGSLHAAAKEFVALGLANISDFETNKAGHIEGMKPGHRVADASLAQSDPDRYILEKVLPALKAHGYDTAEKQISEVRRLFPNGNAADLVSKVITQHEAFANHAKLYDAALGLNADLTKDAKVQLDALNVSLKDFGGIVAEPLMQPLAEELSQISKWLRGVMGGYANWTKDHPAAGAVVGGTTLTAGVVGGSALAYATLQKLLGSAGLNASALALDGAAASLEAAAVALGGKGAIGGLPGALGGKGAAAAEAGIGAAAAEGAGLGVVGTTAVVGATLATLGLTAYEVKNAFDIMHDIDARHADTGPDGKPFDYEKYARDNGERELFNGVMPSRVSDQAAAQIETELEAIKPLAKELAALQRGHAPEQTQQLYRDKIAQHQSEIEKLNKIIADMKALKDGGTPHAANVPLPPIRPKDLDAARNPQKVDVKSDVAVKGDVRGEVEMHQTIKVDPSPLFIAKMDAVQRVNVGLSGKLGQTMAGSNAAQSSGFSGFKPTASGF
jgi:hypothetical protein